MDVSARSATAADLDVLVALYRSLESEQSALSPLWPLAEGLPEPVETAFKEALADPDQSVLVGAIDGVPLGFLVAGTAGLLPQADGARVGQIRYIYTDLEARGVGVGEAMIEVALADLRGRGLRWFDARVSPGHRLAKNFFEASGFSARSIVMHHADKAGG